MAKVHEVWVITRANNQEVIDTASFEGKANVRWIYVDLAPWLLWLKRHGLPAQVYYWLWQRRVGRLAEGLHQSTAFDLVHHLTFGVHWLPSGVATESVPFCFGPVGGAESTPVGLYGTFGFRGLISELVRVSVRRILCRTRSVRRTVTSAALVLAKSPETATELRKMGAHRVVMFSEVAIPRTELDSLGSFPIRTEGKLRFVSTGRLLDLKGFHLGLEAFALLNRRSPVHEYWIIGDGPARPRLEKLADDLGVSPQVKFMGQLARQEVLGKLAECDVVVHPSMHDSGGWVCLEAMAAGRPVICLALGGPGAQMTQSTGYLISTGHPRDVVRDIADAMKQLVDDPDLRIRMGHAGRQHVAARYSRDQWALQIAHLYQMAKAPVEMLPSARQFIGDPAEGDLST